MACAATPCDQHTVRVEAGVCARVSCRRGKACQAVDQTDRQRTANHKPAQSSITKTVTGWLVGRSEKADARHTQLYLGVGACTQTAAANGCCTLTLSANDISQHTHAQALRHAAPVQPPEPPCSFQRPSHLQDTHGQTNQGSDSHNSKNR